MKRVVHREAEHFPTRNRIVHDVTGAGDVALAVLGAGAAHNASIRDIAGLINLAAGLQVERLGVAPISLDELEVSASGIARIHSKVVTLDEARWLAEIYRQLGRRVVFTNGCFDLLHVGHARCLEQARMQGDVLIVAVNSDSSVRRLKGEGRPVIPEAERAAMVAALASVDHVLLFDEPTPHRALEAIRPSVLAKGGGYRIEEVVGREIVEAYGGEVVVFRSTDDVSTSRILARMSGAGGARPSCE